ncbi:TPA: hypothetical protein N0F65_005341 [Lagenidium giganteum]|uniref:Uncharacterized protein n=1 Tax=Lagenidium giganteum TaxID=4803 RepID=A0AAV2YY26_9STRA|nr:TPA: hypothetical protein N0F65_005341 [Lagenidium giganteum]
MQVLDLKDIGPVAKFLGMGQSRGRIQH